MPPSGRRAPIAAAIAALIVCIAAILARGNRSRQFSGLELLAHTGGKLVNRPLEGRLTGGFSYKPLGRGEAAFEHAELTLAEAIARVHGGGERHAWAIAQVLRGHHAEAIKTLQSLHRQKPREAEILSDLSVAYLARGTHRDFATDRIVALDMAERAWRLKQSPEIAWNRALMRSALYIRNAASVAWNDFLRISNDSDWNIEAQLRKQQLFAVSEMDAWRAMRPRILEFAENSDATALEDAVRRFPAHIRGMIEDELIVSWARAHLERECTEARHHHVAAILAKALARRGERVPLDALAAISRGCVSPEGCRRIANEHLRYQDAKHSMAAHEYARAAASLDAVEPVFLAMDSPFALRARADRIACMMHRNEFQKAMGASREFVERAGTRYPSITARAYWLAGLCEVHAARPDESVQSYRRAWEVYRSMDDTANVAAIEGLLADVSEMSGLPDEANEHRVRALAGILASGDRSRYALTVFEAGAGAAERGHSAAADILLQEAVDVSRRDGRMVIAALASLKRSAVAAAENDVARAAEHADVARKLWEAIRDPAVRELVAANDSQVRAVVKRGQARSIENTLSEAIDFFEKSGNRNFLPQLLRQRAALLSARHDFGAAERDLSRALDVCEESLEADDLFRLRDGFVADNRDIYSDLIRLHLEADRPNDALLVAERVRLLGKLRLRDGDLEDTIRILPSASVLIVYELQPRELVSWIVSRGTAKLHRTPVAIDEIDSLVANMLSGAPAAYARLYDLLVRDWIDDVPADSSLVFLPPPELQGVPFAALDNGERTLIDDFAVSLSLSITGYAQSGSVAKIRRTDRLAIVADPAYRDLARLPATRNEANHVVRQYGDVTLLTGEDATKSDFLAALADADVLHFAGHAIVNELTPELSALMLAGDERLYLHEIPGRRSGGWKLVVLSACSTARTAGGSFRGSLSVSRAFLERGAFRVVGTLQPVSDDAAAEFAVEFHRALTRGAAPEQAMRAAQILLKTRPRRSREWTRFCLIAGGNVEGGGNAP